MRTNTSILSFLAVVMIGCNSRAKLDEAQLDSALSNVSTQAVAEIRFVDSSNAVTIQGGVLNDMIAALRATNRLHASAWEGRNVKASIALIDRGNKVAVVGVFRDDSYAVGDYYFTTRAPVLVPAP